MEKGPCKDDGLSNCLAVEGQVVKYIREQRHDFMNHIQVIWGYLQLDKPDKAMGYIGDLNEKFEVMGRLFRMDNPVFSFFFYTRIKKAFKMGIEVDFESDIDHIDNGFILKHYNDLEYLDILFQEVMDKTLNLKDKILYIDLFYEEGIIYITLSNSGFDDFPEVDRQGIGTISPGVEGALEALDASGAYTFYKCEGNLVSFKIGFKLKEA